MSHFPYFSSLDFGCESAMGPCDRGWSWGWPPPSQSPKHSVSGKRRWLPFTTRTSWRPGAGVAEGWAAWRVGRFGFWSYWIQISSLQIFFPSKNPSQSWFQFKMSFDFCRFHVPSFLGNSSYSAPPTLAEVPWAGGWEWEGLSVLERISQRNGGGIIRVLTNIELIVNLKAIFCPFSSPPKNPTLWL